MRTTLVCGLLGAGKTTFIAGVLKDATERAVVLVNDFGAAGIDGEVLRTEALETVELPSGCVCCTMRLDLVSAIEDIKKRFKPEHLVIEPSGLASPMGVLEAIEPLDVGPVTVVGLVDATEFAELYGQDIYGPFFSQQVSLSDLVLINKSDVATAQAVRDARAIVEGLNPGAVVVDSVMASIPEGLKVRNGAEKKVSGGGGGHSLKMDSVSIELKGTRRLKWARGLFRDIASGAYGAVARAKALLSTEEGPIKMDLSSGRVDEARFGAEPARSRLVVIGEGLRREALLLACRREPDGG